MNRRLFMTTLSGIAMIHVGCNRGDARRSGEDQKSESLPTLGAELGVEFQFHLQERVEQFVAAGMSRADAEAEAARRFGDFESYRRLAKQIDEETMRHIGGVQARDHGPGFRQPPILKAIADSDHQVGGNAELVL